MVTIAVATSGSCVEFGLKRRAGVVGRLIAELGCDLLTRGGNGATEIVAQSFCETPGRSGRSIGLISGDGPDLARASLGTFAPYSLAPEATYPHRWIEVPIFTHLPETDPRGVNSLNVQVASGDVTVVVPGGQGTQAEFEAAVELRKPFVAFVERGDRLGDYRFAELRPHAEIVDDEETLQDTLREKLRPFSLPRPSYTKLLSVYETDSTQIHSCTMRFSNMSAIRMSEALAQVVSGMKNKFRTAGVNLCPHDYVRSAEDLAAVLRRADVFGLYDYQFSNPGSVAAINGIKGLAYINVPSFPGQGHIDLWDGTAPAGDAYWSAGPIWFWKLPP